MKIVAVIPSRYNSSRFPGKPLADINGLPMIIRVANQVNKVLDKKFIYIATDDNRIKNVVEQYGYNYIMTKECLTGTDRVASCIDKIDADIYVNVQGDEPMIDPSHIKQIIKEKTRNMNMVINSMVELKDNFDDKTIVKVVTNEKDELVYASRNIIPYNSNKKYRQLGLYAFSKEELNQYYRSDKRSKLEYFEDVEILRFIDIGIKIKMIAFNDYYPSIDTIEDLNKVKQLLKDGDNR